MLCFNYYGEIDVKYFGNDYIGLFDELLFIGEFKDISMVELVVLVDVNVGY